MASKNLIIYLAVFVLAVIATNVSSNPAVSSYAYQNKSHHMIAGSRLPGDRLVLRQNVVKNSSWMKIVTVEKTFNTSKFERITQVKALDQKTNGNGAYASILRGGPGYQNVTLRFKSQRGHGINFVVELYSRP